MRIEQNRVMGRSVHRAIFFLLTLLPTSYFLLPRALRAQQPTTTAPLMEANTHYVGGRTWADFKVSVNSGLIVNVAAGTAQCAPTQYAGGTLTMAASQTNYVYLDPDNSCLPASNTSGYATGAVHLARVVTGASTITSITDDRGFFFVPGASSNIRSCDKFPGANASAKIAACIANLPSSGGTADARNFEGAQALTSNVFSGVTKPGTLLLGAATFTVTATQNISTANWQIIGLGPGTTKIVIGTAGVEPFILTNATNSVIRDLKITGTGNSTVTEIGVEVTGTPGTSVNNEISGVEVTNTTVGIYVKDVAHVKVHHNIIHGQVWDVDDPEGYGILVDNSAQVKVETNDLYSVPRHSIYFGSGTKDSIASHNTIKTSFGSAMQMQGLDATDWTERNIFIGNSIQGVARTGGQTIPARGISILNKSRDNSAIDNTISGTEDEAISVQGSDAETAVPTGNAVKVNTINRVLGLASYAIAANRTALTDISVNRLRGDAASTTVGIVISGSATHPDEYSSATGNTISEFDTCIQITGEVTRPSVSNNTTEYCDTQIDTGGKDVAAGWNTVDDGTHTTLSERSFVSPVATQWSARSRAIVKETVAPNDKEIAALVGGVRLDPANTQNWTNSTGLIGVYGFMELGTSSTGTVSNMAGLASKLTHLGSGTLSTFAGFRAFAKAGSGTVTNLYSFLGDSGAGKASFADGLALPGLTANRCVRTDANLNLISAAGDCGTGGGSGAWDTLTSPTAADTSLSMAAWKTTFTWGNATSTGNLFRLTDTASNTGTGYLLQVDTAASSALKPFRLCYRGVTDCVTFDTSILQATGSATIVANSGDSATGFFPSGAVEDARIDSALARDSEINVQGTTNEIASSGSGVAPTLSLSPKLALSAKEILGASPLVFEGATDDNVYTTLTITDPTLARSFTIPNADSVAVQPNAGASNEFLTSISTLGLVARAQPGFTNLSGSISRAQTPLTARGSILTSDTTALVELALGTVGKYPKSDGTDLVYSSGAASGVGACAASNWVNENKADAAPGCSQPAVASLSDAANLVLKNASNTWSTGAQSMAAATSFIVPIGAGYAPTANGSFGFDSNAGLYVSGLGGTTTMKHLYALDPLPATGNCLKYAGSGEVEDAGLSCERLIPYQATFSSQTTVTVTGATHGFASRQLSIACFDNSSPNKHFEPDAYTVDASSFDVVMTFNPAATGRCEIFGTAGSTIAPHNLLSSSHDAAAVSAQNVDLMYRINGLWDRLPKGTALQVLRVNAAATALEYADPAAGTSVNVNGGSVSNPNFNGTTPAAETNYVNNKWQVSGSSVSAEFPIGALPAGTAVGSLDTGTPKITFLANGMTFSGGSGAAVVDLTNGATATEVANANPGTTANKLAKLSGAPSQATIVAAGATSGAIGVVISGAGTTGNAVIAIAGQASCVFDGATTAGNYVKISASVAGDCTDAGATYPTSGQVLGRVLSTNGGGGTYAMTVTGPEVQAASGGSGASLALDNLAAVAINTSLLPGTAGTVHLGSATKPFGNVFFAGSSGTPGTNNFKITGTSTGGTRVITAPDAAAIIPQSYSCTNQFATALNGSTGATTCSTVTLAGVQFANQGTTTTLLHGNAAGNPSWAGVSLANDTVANQGTTTTVLHGNAAGQPSFGSIVAGDITANTITPTQVSAALYTRSITFIAGGDSAAAALADADDQATIFRNNIAAMTVTEVWCESDGGTPTIMLQRDDGVPANMLTGNLTCTTGGATGTIDTNEDNLAAGDRIDFQIGTAGGTAKRITLAIKATLD